MDISAARTFEAQTKVLNLGFSVATGDFDNDKHGDVAFGTPNAVQQFTITSIDDTGSGGAAKVDVATSTPHSLLPGYRIRISGVPFANYNNLYTIDTVSDATHFRTVQSDSDNSDNVAGSEGAVLKNVDVVTLHKGEW